LGAFIRRPVGRIDVLNINNFSHSLSQNQKLGRSMENQNEKDHMAILQKHLQQQLSTAIFLCFKELKLECDVCLLIKKLFPEIAKLSKLPTQKLVKKERVALSKVEELFILLHEPTLRLINDYWRCEENQHSQHADLFILEVSQLVGTLFNRVLH
jgi:hypothetical protein